METVPSEETNERPSVPAVRVLSVKEISLLVVTPSLLASSVSAFPKVVYGAERSRVPFKAERVEFSATEIHEHSFSFSRLISFGLNLFNC